MLNIILLFMINYNDFLLNGFVCIRLDFAFCFLPLSCGLCSLFFVLSVRNETAYLIRDQLIFNPGALYLFSVYRKQISRYLISIAM